ncbi:MAG: hypothetical protein EOO04_05005 [Chitinophagaceae bacterium]|nr:MAG: hypothetical protein EOO04_05005 [Chitinophagaceae bacterium]
MEQRLLKIVLVQLKLTAALLLICLACYLLISSGSTAVAGKVWNKLNDRSPENEYITTASLKDEVAYTQPVTHVITVDGPSTQVQTVLWQ